MRINKGAYCSANNCFNNRGHNKGLSFFRFPKDPFRCEQWVLKTGRIELLQKHSMHLYHNCRLCAYHFEDDMFMNSHKTSLVHNAIPTIFPNPPRVVPIQRKRLRKKHKYRGKPKQSVSREEPFHTVILPRIKNKPDKHSEPLLDDIENFRVVTVKTEVLGNTTVEEYLIDLRTDNMKDITLEDHTTPSVHSDTLNAECTDSLPFLKEEESWQSEKFSVESCRTVERFPRFYKPTSGDDHVLVCNICGLEYHQMCYLKKHMLTHLDDNPLECRICNNNFRTLRSLKKHVMTHSMSTQ